MLAIARARIDLEIRVHAPHKAHGADIRFRVVSSNNQQLNLVHMGCTKQLAARSISIVDLVAEAARCLDLLDRTFNRGEADLVGTQDARNDLAEAAEADDDDAGNVFLVDGVVNRRRTRCLWHKP